MPDYDPPCDTQRRRCTGKTLGRMCWPVEYDPQRAHASTYVCENPIHRAGAASWVETVTGHAGVFEPFPHDRQVPR